MSPNPHVHVQIDLKKIRGNIEELRRRTGRPVIAVVKADAYGLGATQVAPAIADLVDGFYVFDPAEAIQYGLPATGCRTIAMLCASNDPKDYLSHQIQPVVWDAERAKLLKSAKPILSVDVGQKRYGCEPKDAKAILQAGDIHEAMGHAIRLDQVAILRQAVGGTGVKLHAAATALLDQPEAWLDAVRPGLALYRQAVRISATMIDVRDSTGPAGYSGFVTPRHGLIRCGYSNGLRRGPCLVNGQRRKILEVGMQSAFVELGPADSLGDEVILLGDGLTEDEVAAAWGSSPHEALFRLAGTGVREYRELK
jgi:alanine racemase